MTPTRERLEAQFEPLTQGDQERRTATLTWYTGARVLRFDGRGPFEMQFSMEPGAVRLGRLMSGSAPLLNAHSDYELDDVIGVIERAWIEDGKGRAVVRFSRRPAVDPIWQDVQDGILRNASMGVTIYDSRDVTQEGAKLRQVLVTDWEPEEISLVPIGADAGAGINMKRATSPEEEAMEEAIRQTGEEARVNHVQEAQAALSRESGASVDVDVDAERKAAAAAERARIAELRKIASAARLNESLVAQHIEAGTSVDEFRKLALEELAKRSEQFQPAPRIEMVRDQGETMRQGMAAALLYRHSASTFPLKNDLGREWVGMSLLELARECLHAKGVRTNGMPRHDIAKLALSTSDFPFILADVANKTLRQAYEAYPRTFTTFCRRASAADFKDIHRVQLGEAPALREVAEGGEFTRGSMAEARERYRVKTYGRVVPITRQTIVNDDLGAFTRVPAAFGVAAATLESDVVWGLITSNVTLSDGVQLFHSSRGNALTGASSALGLTGLGEAMAVMAKFKGLDGSTVLNIQPRYLIVPAALQMAAYQIISPNLVPAQTSNVVPEYMRVLSPVVEPRLDAASATAWYLAADPNQIDTIEYAYLDGQDGVYIETRQGFDVDGVEIKARLDFGAGVIDWRGLLRSAGA